MKKIRVAVMGAGLSGLTTAYLLQNQELEDIELSVSVFEPGSELPHEHFPFPVADTDTETIALAKALQLDLIPLRRNEPLPHSALMRPMIAEILHLRSSGVIRKPNDWSNKESDILDILDSMSVIEYFIQKEKDPDEVQSLLSAGYLGTYTDNLSQLSALDALRFLSQYLFCQLTYQFEQGANAFVNALADVLDPYLFFNVTVTKLEKKGRRFRLSFDNADPQMFDIVVRTEIATSSRKCYRPGERRFISKTEEQEDGVLFVGEKSAIDAPASMQGVIKSVHRLLSHSLMPAIHSQLPCRDELLTPAVSIAVFTSGNDACLEEETNL